MPAMGTNWKQNPASADDGTPLVRLETKLTAYEETIITRMKLDITAYRCRREKILLLITKRNTEDT